VTQIPEIPKHRERAIQAIAGHTCSTELTDGFCSPRDGKCIGQKGERPDHRNCVVKAKGYLQALDSVGVKVVWTHDPILRASHPDPIIDAAERAALGLP
jgi:hypothetical protein